MTRTGRAYTNKRTRIEVLATNVHFLGTKKQETTQSETQHEEDALEDFDDQVIEDDLELPFWLERVDNNGFIPRIRK